jgi:zinc D-Ala-D-Ala carboxypeptidase
MTKRFIKRRPGKFFTWEEMTTTSKHLLNHPSDDTQRLMVGFVKDVLDPIRRHLGEPLFLTSAYRSLAVNNAVGGSSTSLHRRGTAADCKARGMSSRELAQAILDSGVPFDQLIAYAPERGGHVHIHVKVGSNVTNREQVMWAPASGGYRSLRLTRESGSTGTARS